MKSGLSFTPVSDSTVMPRARSPAWGRSDRRGNSPAPPVLLRRNGRPWPGLRRGDASAGTWGGVGLANPYTNRQMLTAACILVVDDDPDSREVVAELLILEGFRVETADDGFDALVKLSSLRPDLMVTDLEMPGMDGIELIRRAGIADGASPAILMTAHGEERRAEARRRGASAVLAKPLDPDQLVNVVRRTITPRVEGGS